MSMKPTGRPKGQKNKSPPYNLQLVQTILDASLEDGANIKSAATERGVPYSTLWGWMQRHPEARAALEANQAERSKRNQIVVAGKIKSPGSSIRLDVISSALDMVSNEGMTLTQAARQLGIKHGSLWAAIHKKGLVEDYRRAMHAGSHALAESSLEILDDDSGDIIEQPDGRLLVNGARVKRDQARASQRMVLAARANPEYYGPPAQARAPSITINIDADKLQRIRDVSAQTLEQIGKDDSSSGEGNSG